MLKYLGYEAKEKEEPNNPLWEELKKFNKDN
jgi:hypothetical protein